jgi:hypothetical protein
MRIDFHSAWKDTTEVYFAALLELFEPQSLPRACDHEPVSFLDQEMQELAQVLGDEGGAEVDVGGGDTVAAGSESQPYHGSRRGRWRARKSGRLRVDKLVRVPLPMGARGASEGAGLTAGRGANTDATRALAKDQSASKTGRIPTAKALTGSPAKAKPA